jgi:3-oxoacyl-[acyl-carrier-protein] synthase III
MTQVNISNIDINFPRYSYTVEEIVEDLLSEKLDREVKNFCKHELGIERIYISYDLSKISNDDTDYREPDIQLNDMYVSIAKRILDSTKRLAQDIGFLITINDNQQYLDPAPAVEIVSRIGLNKDIRTQNYQGISCSSFS